MRICSAAANAAVEARAFACFTLRSAPPSLQGPFSSGQLASRSAHLSYSSSVGPLLLRSAPFASLSCGLASGSAPSSSHQVGSLSQERSFCFSLSLCHLLAPNRSTTFSLCQPAVYGARRAFSREIDCHHPAAPGSGCGHATPE